MIKSFLLILMFIFLAELKAGKDYTNNFTLGAGGNTSDTFLYMNSTGEGRLKWDNANNRLQYSEDSGSNYVDLRDSLRGLTTGSLLFGDTDGSTTQDGNNLFWDNTNNRLGILTGTPNYALDVNGQSAFGGQTILAGSGGLELVNNNNIQFYESTGNGTDKITLKAPTALSASYSMNLPSTQGTANNRLVTDGSGNSSWRSETDLSMTNGLKNISLTATVSSGDITITLLGAEGSALSTSNVASIVFHDNSSPSTGKTYPVTLNSNQTITVSGSLGQTSPAGANNIRIYVYAVYQTSTSIEFGVSSTLFREQLKYATTTNGVGSNSANVLYTNTGVSANSIRLIGWIDSARIVGGDWVTPTYVTTATYENLMLDEISKPNHIDNPQFMVSQRGDFSVASSATTATYYVDRWKTDFSGVTVNKQNSTSTSAVPINTKTKVGRSFSMQATSTASGYMTILQYLEDSSQFYGKTITVSAKIRSNSSNTRMMVYDGVTYQGGTLNNHSGGNDWETLTATFIGSSTGTWRLYVGMIGPTIGAPNVSITSGEEFYVTNVKLEINDYPTPFESYSVEEDYERCYRFYYRYNYVSTTYKMPTVISPENTSTARSSFPTPTVMRASAVVGTDTTAWNVYGATGTAVAGTNTLSSGALLRGNTQLVRFDNATNYTTNSNNTWQPSNGTYIDFSADL
jgi:hypothetical protein